MRKLLILTFIVGTGVNSLAGVEPHMDGEGGCAASCCEAARHGGPQSRLSKLCCMMERNQPGGTQAPSPANAIVSARHNGGPAASLGAKVEFAFSVGVGRLSSTPARAEVNSPLLYLNTGTLLI